MSIKIVDKTPFRDENGQINIIDQIQARLKFGFNWLGEVRAQDQVVSALDKQLDRTYTILHNVPLPGTEVLLPLVLAGPAGVFLLNATNMRGVYRAKGEEWGTIDGTQLKAAPVNLVVRTARLAAGLQKFLDRQGLEGTVHVEGVLLAVNPGLIVDSVRPIVRIVMSDALDRFGISLVQAPPTLSPDKAQTIVNRILNPAPPKRETHPATEFSGQQSADTQERAIPMYTPQTPAFIEDETTPGTLDANDFSFAFNDEQEPKAEKAADSFSDQAGIAPIAQPAAATDQAAPLHHPIPTRPTPANRLGIMGLSTRQLAVLGGLLIFLVCIMVVFIIVVLWLQ
jgi:hypothetical protein